MKVLEQLDTGTCTKTLKIEIPRDDITSEMDGVYKEFNQNATVPGFRKGRAPRNIIQMRYGKHLEEEAINKSIESAYKKALEDLDLNPVTEPKLDDLKKDDENEPISFSIKFEYAPNIEVAEYKDIRAEEPDDEVAEKDVVEMLDRIRQQNATFASIDDRSVQDDDFVTISSRATIDDEPFADATHDEIVVQIGSERYIPGLEDALRGVALDEEKTVTLTLPDDYPIEEKRGKEVVFELKVKQIREQKLPELDDELAKDMGDFQTLDDLKEHIRGILTSNLEERKAEQKRASVRTELLSRNQFDVPPSMVRAQCNYINSVQDMEFRRQGTNIEQESQRDAGLMARNEKSAEEEVRLTLILGEIADNDKIELEDVDYFMYVNQLAQREQMDPAQYMKQIESRKMDNYYRRLAMEDKVVNIIIAYSDADSTEEQDAPAQDESTDETED